MFSGFTEKTGAFLWDLAFNNERPWFLAHKQEFEDEVNTPFKALAADTYAALTERFPSFEGGVHISRIYRDARRLFGRGPYKDHLWFSVKTSDILLEGPMFWFEIGPAQYAFGMGFYSATPAQMEAFRRAVDANPARFKRLAQPLARRGWALDGERYKRPKALHGDELIDDWYNRKYVGLDKHFDWDETAYSAALPALLTDAWAELMPMYEFLKAAYLAAPTEPDKKR